MKKYLLSIPVMLYPYTLIVGLVCLYTPEIMEGVFAGNGFLLIAALFACAAVAFAFALGVAVSLLLKGGDALSATRLTLVLKIVHIPAYIVIFLLGVLFTLSIWGIIFVVVFVLTDIAAIIMTGMYGAAAAFRCRAQGLIGTGEAIALGVCQFIFCIDVASIIVQCVLIRKGAERRVEYA